MANLWLRLWRKDIGTVVSGVHGMVGSRRVVTAESASGKQEPRSGTKVATYTKKTENGLSDHALSSLSLQGDGRLQDRFRCRSFGASRFTRCVRPKRASPSREVALIDSCMGLWACSSKFYSGYMYVRFWALLGHLAKTGCTKVSRRRRFRRGVESLFVACNMFYCVR